MTNPYLLVLTNPVEGRDAEYNDWYTDTHLSEVLQVPGIVAAQRWRVAEESAAGPPLRYLAIYELDDRPTADVIAALFEAAQTMTMSSALGEAQMVLYEPLTERLVEGSSSDEHVRRHRGPQA